MCQSPLLPELSYNVSSVRSGVVVHKDGPVSQWMIIKMGYNMCAKHVVAVCNAFEVTLKYMFKSNLQLKEKHLQTDTPPPSNAVILIMFPSWNAVLFKCHHSQTRPSTGRNKNLLSFDQWTRFQLRIPVFRRRWSRDQLYRTRRWRNECCGRLNRLLTVLTDTWPQNANSWNKSWCSKTISGLLVYPLYV